MNLHFGTVTGDCIAETDKTDGGQAAVPEGENVKRKIVLAYSGSLYTAAIIPWLKENHDCDVIAVCVDIGQNADWKEMKSIALKAGAAAFHTADAKKEYVEEYLWPALKAGAVYEDKYLLGSAAAKPLIAKTIAGYARSEGADAVAHGANGRSNDQLRLDLALTSLAPDLEIIAPWRVWKISSRESAIRFLAKRGLPVPASKKNAYSRDESVWHVSHEGLELKEPGSEPALKKMLVSTVTPERASSKPGYVEIGFEKGTPVSLNGRKTDSLALLKALNKTGGENGIGITDLVENSIAGTKHRSVYETPGGSILHYAHRELEHACLDRQTYSYKQQTALKLGELIYGGQWFSPLRKALDAFVESTQEAVSGTVKLKLYKGSISPAGVQAPGALFASGIEEGDLYTQSDAKGFARLYAMPDIVRSVASGIKTTSKGEAKTKTAGTKAPGRGRPKAVKK